MTNTTINPPEENPGLRGPYAPHKLRRTDVGA